MIKRITFGLMSCMFAASAFAAVSEGPTCEAEACFSEVQVDAISSQVIQDAPKFAWYQSNTQSKGWAFGSKGKRSNSGSSFSSGGSSSWFTNVPSKGPVNSRGTFVFYPGKSTFAAYDSTGNLVTSGRASGGMNYCDDIGQSCRTPVGTFRIRSKGGADCVSNKYPVGEGGAPMPYCMFFNGGYAVHGSYHVPNHPASHGCIRLEPATALWLRDNFMQIGTVVKVQPYYD